MKYLFFIFIICSTSLCYAQSEIDDIAKIPIFVNMPSSFDGINQSQKSKIESRITSLLSANGLSGKGWNKSFAITPQFEIYDERKVEGMQNIFVIDAEIDLQIKNMIDGVIYSSYNLRLVGSGKTRELAINSAIRNLPLKDDEVAQFIESAKTQIIKYYNSRCPEILSKAQALSETKNYSTALAVLMQVPEEAGNCYTQVTNKSISIYNLLMEQNCQKQLQLAKTNEASNNYKLALSNLSKIDPNTSCASEALQLINQLALKVDEREKQDWDMALMRYNDQRALQMFQLKTMKEITLAEFKSRPKEVHYSLFGF